MTHMPIEKDSGPARIVMPAPTDERYAHLGWPKMVKTTDGSIYLAYLTASEHTKDGCPAVAKSTDGGRTFADPMVLADYHEGLEYAHSGNLAIGEAGDGSIVLLAMALTPGNVSSDIFGWRSTDKGISWNAVDTQALTGSVYGTLFTVPNRGLAVMGHLRKGSRMGETGLWIAFSEDSGCSWQKPNLVTDMHLYEPAFLYTDGRIIGLAKGPETQGYLQFVSDDLGDSWTSADSGIGRELNMTSPCLFADPDHPGCLFSFETQRHRSPSNEYPGYIRLWTAESGSLKWQPRQTIAAFEPQDEEESYQNKADYGYPWMVKMDESSWFCVFYCGYRAGTNPLWGLDVDMRRMCVEDRG